MKIYALCIWESVYDFMHLTPTHPKQNNKNIVVINSKNSNLYCHRQTLRIKQRFLFFFFVFSKHKLVLTPIYTSSSWWWQWMLSPLQKQPHKRSIVLHILSQITEWHNFVGFRFVAFLLVFLFEFYFIFIFIIENLSKIQTINHICIHVHFVYTLIVCPSIRPPGP